MPRIAARCIACQHTDLERQPAVLMPFLAERALGWTPVEITPAWGLRDLKAGWAHALCCTLHCPHCGMVFLDMRFDDAEMGRLYAGYRGSAYVEQRERHEPGYSARNDLLVAGDTHIPMVESLLAPWLPDHPAVLDWGGDTGLNTPLRCSARLHHVLDISGSSVIPGVQVIDSPDYLSARYDLVVLSNVLEHVPEPRHLLMEIVQCMGRMAPQVRLYVEVPFESLMLRTRTEPGAWRDKHHWHEHINFFSKAALQELLKAVGLTVLSCHEIELVEGGVQLALICGLAR